MDHNSVRQSNASHTAMNWSCARNKLYCSFYTFQWGLYWPFHARLWLRDDTVISLPMFLSSWHRSTYLWLVYGFQWPFISEWFMTHDMPQKWMVEDQRLGAPCLLLSKLFSQGKEEEEFPIVFSRHCVNHSGHLNLHMWKVLEKNCANIAGLAQWPGFSGCCWCIWNLPTLIDPLFRS